MTERGPRRAEDLEPSIHSLNAKRAEFTGKPGRKTSGGARSRHASLLPAPSPLGEYATCKLHGGAFSRGQDPKPEGISSVGLNFPIDNLPRPALSGLVRRRPSTLSSQTDKSTSDTAVGQTSCCSCPTATTTRPRSRYSLY